MPPGRQGNPPEDVRIIREELRAVLARTDATGQQVGRARCGVYAFYDFDAEPIYVGQTYETLKARISRHLTNQRTDAVAMSVLDPFEVAEIEVWPLWTLVNVADMERKRVLDATEHTVFQQLLAASTFRAVLNEVPPYPTESIALPASLRARIVPSPLFERRKHPDVRIARRAATIARLAHIISERAVQPGLRATLLTQAKRLEHLARQRVNEVGGPAVPGESAETDDE